MTEPPPCLDCRGHGVFASGLVCNRCGGTGRIKRMADPPPTSAQERLKLADEIDASARVAQQNFQRSVLVGPETLHLWGAALRSADEEIARLKDENDTLHICASEINGIRLASVEIVNRAEQAEAALAEMRRMVEEPSEVAIDAVAKAMFLKMYHWANWETGEGACPMPLGVDFRDAWREHARAGIAALARHLPADFAR